VNVPRSLIMRSSSLRADDPARRPRRRPDGPPDDRGDRTVPRPRSPGTPRHRTPGWRRVALVLTLASFGASAACDGGHVVLRDAPTDTLVDVNGTRLWVHVETGPEGDAERIGTDAIVVVHGGPLLDHGYLVEPLRPLASRAPLVFYDQRLSGRSDGVAAETDSAPVLSLGTFVEDIEALRRALDLDRIHLLAHSWGGGLAMRYALAHPERVRSLILVSPPAPSFDLASREARALGESLEPADTAGLGVVRASQDLVDGDPRAIARMLRMSFRAQVVDRATADGLVFEIPDDYLARSEAMRVLGRELAGSDLTSELRGLDVPTLVMYGAAEPAAELTGPAFEALLPDVRVETIAGARHFAFMERGEAFRSLVVQFLGDV